MPTRHPTIHLHNVLVDSAPRLHGGSRASGIRGQPVTGCGRAAGRLAETGSHDPEGLLRIKHVVQSRGTPDVSKIIGMGEVYPINPTDYIKAMDRFAAPGKTPGKRFQLWYGLLSESAHPAMRGSKPFCEVLAHRQFAWLLRYHAERSCRTPRLFEWCSKFCVIQCAWVMALQACCESLKLACTKTVPPG